MRLSDVEAAFEPSNPRRHDVTGIADSIRERGFNAPPMLNEKTGRLVYGHGRTKGVRQLFGVDPEVVPTRIQLADDGEWMLPVFRGVSFKSKNEAEEYLMADNRLAELGGWDPEPTAKILLRIRERGNLVGTGFTSKRVEQLLYEIRKGRGPREVPPVSPPAKPITQVGDLWELGPHRLVCGDSTKGALEVVLQGRKADMVWIDPPYGVDYSAPGRAAKLRRTGVDDRHESIKNDNIEGLEALLRASFAKIIASTKKGAPWYVTAPPGSITFSRELDLVGVHRQTLVWVKDSFVVGRSHFHYRHEAILYGWSPGHSCLHPPPNRKQDTVWNFDRPKVSAEHPTMKPIALVAHAIELSSAKGDLVVDAFGGSGTTLLAADQLKRVAALVELSPAYCDVIIQRWENLTGKKARRVPRD